MILCQVIQVARDAVLWVGEANTEAHALDVMAREAGYRRFAAIADHLAGDVRVEAIECRNSPPAASRLDPRLLVLVLLGFLPGSETLSAATLPLGCL